MPPKKKKEPEKPLAEEAFQVVEVCTREPKTVVLLLDSPEPALICKACDALHKHMEKSEQHCVELQALGLAAQLVRLLSHEEKATRAFAVLCLSDMARVASLRPVLSASGCLPPLLPLISSVGEEQVTRQQAVGVLADMAIEYHHKAELLRLQVHKPLLQLLAGTEPDTLRSCLTALNRMAEVHLSRPAIAAAGGIPLLLSLCDSEYPPIQQLSLKTLHSLLHDNECCCLFRESQGLEKLVAIIGSKECSDLHPLTVSILSLCLQCEGSMAALQTAGTLQQLLLHVSSSTDPGLQTSATEALVLAAGNDMNRKILHEQSAEKMFIELLANDNWALLVASLQALAALCGLSSSQQVIGQCGGVERIVKCGRSEDEKVRSAAAHTLVHVSRGSPANCKLIQESGGCSVLIQLLSDLSVPSCCAAASCVSQLALSEVARAELLAAGVVPALVAELMEDDSGAVASAAEALTMMAAEEEARAQFLSSGGVGAVLSQLQSADSKLVGAAVLLVRATAQSTAVAEEFCHKGGLEMLTQISQQSSGVCYGPALDQLLASNLPAKWWVQGRLTASDIIRDCEFFDAGLALSASSPYTSLSTLLSQPLHMNRPILVANLLARPAPLAAVEEVAPPSPPPSQPQNRAKSRGKSRKSRDVESQVSDSPSEEPVAPAVTEIGPVSLLPLDIGLWEHINYTHSHITPLTTITEQAEALASYVCLTLGGPASAPQGVAHQLPTSQTQAWAGSNVIPLGDITTGTYQHRALLFKVLADQLGIPCSLMRGDYGRHWNEVAIATDGTMAKQSYVVDLMMNSEHLTSSSSSSFPLHLLPSSSPLAHQYTCLP